METTNSTQKAQKTSLPDLSRSCPEAIIPSAITDSLDYSIMSLTIAFCSVKLKKIKKNNQKTFFFPFFDFLSLSPIVPIEDLW